MTTLEQHFSTVACKGALAVLCPMGLGEENAVVLSWERSNMSLQALPACRALGDNICAVELVLVSSCTAAAEPEL